jgi:uncharacterized membrane protein (UPF0136 family)
MSNHSSISEDELYEPVKNWLHKYLIENTKSKFVKTFNGANETMAKLLIREGLTDGIENALFFDIKIDIFAVIEIKKKRRLVIVECKKDTMGLVHLGQLIGYSQIINPWLSILLSPTGITSGLNNFIVNHKMDRLMRYGEDGKIIICTWEIAKNAPDVFKTIPKGGLDPISLF